MARSNSSTKARTKKRDWRTTVWYVIGALIVFMMIFSLIASAIRY